MRYILLAFLLCMLVAGPVYAQDNWRSGVYLCASFSCYMGEYNEGFSRYSYGDLVGGYGVTPLYTVYSTGYVQPWMYQGYVDPTWYGQSAYGPWTPVVPWQLK
jgi:hypothetical protein